MTKRSRLQVRIAYLIAMWQSAIEPKRTVQEPEELLQARISASVFLSFIGVILLLFIVRLPASITHTSELITRVGLLLLLGIAYYLSRRGYSRLAHRLSALLATISLLVLAGDTEGWMKLHILSYLSVIVLYSGVFLASYEVVFLFLVQTSGILLLALLSNEITFQMIINGPLSFNFTLLISTLLIKYHHDLLEKNRLERLIATQTRYKSLFEQSNDAVLILDLNGNHLDSNERATEMVGYSFEEFKALGFQDIWVDVIECHRRLQALLAGEQILPYEQLLLHKNGKAITVEVNIELVHDSDGSPSYVQCVIRDISKRKRTEQELRILTLAVEQSNAMIVITNNLGEIEYVNPKFSANTGYAFEEVLGQNPYLVQTGLMPPDYYVKLWSTITSGDDWHGEILNKKKNGDLYWESAMISPILDEKGIITHFVAIKEDITANKQAEQLLRARLQLSEFALTHSIDELIQKTLDEAERLTNSNIGFFHFLNIDQETLTLQSWSTNTLANMCTVEAKGHHYPIREAGVWVDCIYQRKPVIHNDYASLSHQKGMPAGHATVVRELVVPIIRNNLIVAILGIGNKDTEYDNTDIEIVYQLANMAWDIIARKRTEIELLRSEEVIALKDRFVSTVSHEFRTPLAIMQTSSDLLSLHFDRLTPERREEILNQIGEQIVHLNEMVSGVLSLGRAQSGKIEFNPTQIELASFCQSIFEQMQLADQAQHQFIFTNRIADQNIVADFKLLKHVLINLLSNALKYSSDGTQVVLELDYSDENVTIEVRDEGFGISEEDQLHLFEPFHRAKNIDHIEGTGLGLSIVKEYIDLHGGRVEVVSEVDRGSKFKIILPIR